MIPKHLCDFWRTCSYWASLNIHGRLVSLFRKQSWTANLSHWSRLEPLNLSMTWTRVLSSFQRGSEPNAFPLVSDFFYNASWWTIHHVLDLREVQGHFMLQNIENHVFTLCRVQKELCFNVACWPTYIRSGRSIWQVRTASFATLFAFRFSDNVLTPTFSITNELDLKSSWNSYPSGFLPRVASSP